MSFKHIYPEFKTGSILSQFLLEQLREFPNEFANLHYEKYGDGILCGLEIIESIDKEKLILQKGIVKLQNNFWLLTEDFIFLRKQEMSGNLIFNLDNGNVEIKQNFDKNREFSLGYIKADGGLISGKLRSLDFYKKTFDNYIDRSNIPYSVYGGQLPMLEIIHLFGKKMMAKKGISNKPIDFNFAMLCLGKAITFEQIKQYLIFKGKNLNDDVEVKEIYEHLVSISEEKIYSKSHNHCDEDCNETTEFC